ncbi:L,D-transpeptidase family protein [Desulfobotulus sp. H1]|uniref:L,D-transpeptidase family protein n=1 Tax=Desulfobotulus pelophilus TaxID=2823377 RepID=A0ABT3NCY7_9BACT|nr:L,D-transpeptidase family protein [Desulfobotulus pelophilus]MCW7755330.1 L,D-transpeptidase family protein [Desulfobotulus pelophilus]
MAQKPDSIPRSKKHTRLLVILLLVSLAGPAGWFTERHLPVMLAKKLPEAESVLVIKSERKLFLLRKGSPYRTYGVAIGGNPLGPKQEEGDQRTPEGDYVLDWRNPNSAFYLSLHLSYPNRKDQDRAKALGMAPGGMIMIHGQPNGLGWMGPLLQLRNWTDGCIALTNTAMAEVWQAVPDGTPIRIEP